MSMLIFLGMLVPFSLSQGRVDRNFSVGGMRNEQVVICSYIEMVVMFYWMMEFGEMFIKKSEWVG